MDKDHYPWQSINDETDDAAGTVGRKARDGAIEAADIAAPPVTAIGPCTAPRSRCDVGVLNGTLAKLVPSLRSVQTLRLDNGLSTTDCILDQ